MTGKNFRFRTRRRCSLKGFGRGHSSSRRSHKFKLYCDMRPRIQEPGKGAAARSLVDTDLIVVTALVLTSFVIMGFQFLTTEEGKGIVANLPEVGEALACVLWAVSLWYASPLQLLFLFFGKIDTERPSDWILKRLPEVPIVSVPTTMLVCFAVGTAIARSVDAACGDTTWGVASSMGALAGAGMYELGRPRRLSEEEREALDRKWADFVQFADEGLERKGRCHESEVERAFRASAGRYRDPSSVSIVEIRKFVRNWEPSARRSSNGFYVGISVAPRT